MKTRKKPNVRFIAALLALAVVLGVGVHFVHGYQNKRNAHALLWQADQAKEAAEKARKDKDRAKEDEELGKEIECLNRYLGFVPDDAAVLARFSERLDEQAKKSTSPNAGRERVRAFFYLEEALRRNPERRDLRRRQVDTALDLGRASDALAHLKVLYKDAPRDEKAGLEQLMGRCEDRLGNFNEAVKWYEKAIQNAPEQLENYQRVAVLYRERLNNTGKADDAIRAMVDNNESAFKAYLLRVRYHLRYNGNSRSAAEEAAADVKAAQKLAPTEPEVALVAAQVAQIAEKPDEARTLLSNAIEKNPGDARHYLALMAMHVRDNQPQEALRVIREGLKSVSRDDKQYNDLLHAEADLLVQNGELEEAQTRIARLREAKYAPPLLDYLQARIHVRKGQWSDAARLLDKVRPQLTRAPALEVQALLLLGQCAEQLGNPDQALFAYRQASKLDPLSIAAHYRTGAILMTLGRSEEALDEFHQVLANPKAPTGIHTLMARALIARNLRLPQKERKLDEIQGELERANRETPGATDVTILQAQALLLEDPPKNDAARQLLDKARQGHPDDVALWLTLAQLASSGGKTDEALRLLDQAQARPKLAKSIELQLARLAYWTVPPATKEQAQIDKHKEEAQRALKATEKKVAELPETDQPRLLGGLADAYARLGDTEKAKELWEEIRSRQPNNLSVRLILFDLAMQARAEADITDLLKEIRRIEGENGAFWRYAEASRLLQKARPADKEGLSDRDRRLLREARPYLAEANKLRPSWPRVLTLDAEIDELMGDVPEAIKKYQQAVKLGERRPVIVRRLVQLLLEQRRFAEANEAVRQLLGQENLLMAAGLGKLATQALLTSQDPASRDTEHILQMAQRSVAADSKRYQDHLWLGRIQWSLGKTAEADKTLRHALKLADTVPETWVTLVEFLAGTKQKKAAEEAIKQARQKLPADKAPLALAACYEAVGDMIHAEEQLQAARKAQPGNLPVLLALAGFYLRTSQPAKAEPVLRDILALDTNALAEAAWARRSLALVLAARGQPQAFKEAQALIDKNLAENKDSTADQHVHVLLLATRRSQRKEALRLYEELDRHGSLTAAERFRVVQLYEADDNWDQAREHMETLLRSPEGKNPAFPAYYARRLLLHGAVADAEEQLKQLEKTIPDSPITREIRARVLKARGKDAEALAEVRAYARSEKADLGSAGQLLDMLGRMGDPDGLFRKEAEAMYRQHVQQSDKPERFLLLAAFLTQQRATVEAFRCCEEAIKQRAAPEAVSPVLAALVRQEGEPGNKHCQAMERWLKEAIDKAPNSVTLRVSLADLYDLEGRFSEAEKMYTQILEKDEENAIALNNLAWLLAFKQGGARSEEALRMVNRAIELIGPLPECLDTRAVLYLKMKRTKEAIEDLNNALEKVPSAIRYFHLAQAFLMENNLSEARLNMQKASKQGFDLKRLHPLEKGEGQRLLKLLKTT